MIMCKYRAILLFLLIIIYLNEVGARKNRNTRRKGCKLSEDERYMYWNMNGDEIKPGDYIVVGDTLTVKCRFTDEYSYDDYDFYEYSALDYYDTYINTMADEITISCKDDHTMTKILKECPEETKDERCLTIDNGNVQKLDGYYVVSCHKGFSIDIIEPEEKKSNCIDGILKSVFGGQEPKCVPDRCQVPYDYDTLLSISDRFHVSLSGGSVVEVGDYVHFNCSKAMEDMHEPVNRRFKCINGQWIEDERDKLWKFGNNGTFPKCRKTICEPECENGGVCLRDDECNCKHFTSGKHCENVLCDDKCKANNGECVGPGKCRCPEGKFGTNCELKKCTKPDKVSNARLKTRYERKEWFKDGDKVKYRCQPGYTMEGTRNQRWCRKGNWTGVLFTCNQKCTKPDNISKAELKTKYKRKERFNDGDSVEYKCQPGYTKEGTTKKRWCRKGKWTGVRFSCNPDHPYRQSKLNQDLKVYGDISIDQILAKTNNKENVGNQEFELMELDIIVDKSVKTPSSNRANINKDNNTRWEEEIHYAIGDEISTEHENEIRKAIPVWQKYSCLSFSENKKAYNRIEFELAKDNMCASSNVGMKQGTQTIKLGETCFKTEIILHEIAHALGFYHEHNRWDRDDYIKIHYENIEPGKNQSFQKQENAVVDTNYDYLSIMHYGQYFFSRNESAKLITIETKNDTFQSKIGKAKHPSFQDYKTLNVMFKCADWCPNIECPEAGFVGKNCKCYCKGNPDDTPVRLCNKTGECRRPTVNKYLFYVMGKDKTIPVSINRTSFPDKTVLNLVSTNWECTSHFQLRCEDGDWKEISIAECPVTLNISLTDETEGVVKVTLNGVNDGYICDDDWDDNDATVACKMLGYTKGLALFPKAKEVNESLPILLDNVQCSGEELSLADCKHNGWGNHDCEYLEVVSVKCFDDSYSNHINATTNITCGKIKLHNHNSKRKKRQVRVIGGLETEKGMLPWQVNIQRKIRGRIRNWCGGTIINKEWILSAAHCFEYQKKTAKLIITDIRVIVGDNDLTKHDEYEKMFEVEYIVRHWNYTDFNGKYNNNDIALLKVKSTSGITFNDYIQPACLPEDLTLPLSETKCEVSGWGKTNFSGERSDKLKAVEVPIISYHVCQSNYNKYSIDFEKVICAGDTTADACLGDSGGPLICNINGLSTVVGITSWGEGCGQKDSPGVYTKVSAYIKWINEQISNHRVEAQCAKPKQVKNAVLRDEYANKEKFKEGDKVEYDCELGYTIEGITMERWCKNTKWTDVRFTCKQITCPWVPHPDNGRHLDTTYAVGDVMKFDCNIGYMLKGRDVILCRKDGQWSPPQGPTCDPILCPTLPQIQHGSIFQDTSDGLANNYESVAEYTCDRDYYLNGNTHLKTVRRTCQSDGKWSGKEPICEVPKCHLIDNFYGGSVEYFGRRDLYSQAFYSCDENYSMIPSNVQHSTCENNLRWEPPPPKCLKKADRYVPNTGYLSGWTRGKVSHGESYKICCKKGFEVERDDNVPVNKEECTDIRNNNGTLKPSVACVEELCETASRHTEYKHEDGSEFTSRIPSNEMVWMRCKKGYAFYDNRNQPLPSPQKRRCIRGKIQDAPTCIEAKSSLVGYPYRPFTLYRDSKRNILDRNKYIEPNERIEVFCSDGYELYVEFNKVYLDEFFTTSRYGEFDKEKNKFPVCLESKMYLISTKTGKRFGAGTNAHVYITLFGSKGSTRRIDFRGKFESGDVDETRTFARDVRPIDSVQIGHDGDNILSDWDLEYVSIYVEHMEEFYVFRNIKQQWVKEGNDLTLHREGNQECINTFSKKYLWFPKWNNIKSFYLGEGQVMSRRACKQACINWDKNVCNGVFRNTIHHNCLGFSETRDNYFTVQNEPWYGELFFRTCKKFN